MHRLFFMHSQYINDSILTLKFDKLILNLERTTFYYGPSDLSFDLANKYQLFNINTDNFTFVKDRELVNPYCESIDVDIYKFNGWISQQLLKLIALDQCDAEQILIQDCDTFAISPYKCFVDNVPCCMYLPFKTPKEYREYVTKFLGIECTGIPLNFVTEFMPILKQDWIVLKNQIESRFECHWLEAIYKQFKKDFIVVDQIWFSEYELLGCWNYTQHSSMQIIPQKRFVLKNSNKITSILNTLINLKNYNFIANYRAVDFDQIALLSDAINKQLEY